MTTFKVGDKVVVKERDQLFTTYDQWAEDHHLDKYEYARGDLKSGDTATVIAVGVHDRDSSYGQLCGIEKGGKQYIITSKGLELYKSVQFKVGDKVKIARKISSKDSNGMGVGIQWDNNWNFKMDEHVGKITTISSGINRPQGVYLEVDDRWFAWPLAALELVEEKTSNPYIIEVGDVVRVIDTDGSGYYKIGEEGVVETIEQPYCKTSLVKLVGKKVGNRLFLHRFELVLKADEIAEANGFDALGASFDFNPQVHGAVNQRVVMENGNTYIVQKDVQSDGKLILVNNDATGWTHFVLDAGQGKRFKVAAVYNHTQYNYQLLNADLKGELVWESKEHNTIRKAALEKLEKAVEDAANEAKRSHDLMLETEKALAKFKKGE